MPTATLTLTLTPTPTQTPPVRLDVRILNLATSDLVASGATGQLYASIPSRAGSIGNSVTSVDPSTGAVASPVWIGSEPDHLAVSSDGRYLYAVLDVPGAVRRFDVASRTPRLQWDLGMGPLDFTLPNTARGIVAVPGSPSSVVVSPARISGNTNGLVVYDDGVPHPNLAYAGSTLAFSSDASVLYAADSVFGNGLSTVTIDPNGAAVRSVLPGSTFYDTPVTMSRERADRRKRLYLRHGRRGERRRTGKGVCSTSSATTRSKGDASKQCRRQPNLAELERTNSEVSNPSPQPVLHKPPPAAPGRGRSLGGGRLLLEAYGRCRS